MPNEFMDVQANPGAQAKVDEILNEANKGPEKPKPEIGLPPESYVRLSGGSVIDGKRVMEAEVTELTGEHEERLAKARGATTRWFNTLLQCGTVTVGGKPAEDVLDDLLVGDRDALILGIRAVTYGPEIDLGTLRCSGCGEEFDAVLDISKDVPHRAMTGEPTFEVKLRKGGVAKVRLPNGADQTAYTEDDELTSAERNSLLLSRVIISLPGDLGEMPVAGFPSLVRELGVADRRNILAEIDKRMPGPRYDEVEIEHDECGTKIPVPLGLVPLFPGL